MCEQVLSVFVDTYPFCYFANCFQSPKTLNLRPAYRISFPAPSTEICCLHSQVYFRLSKKSFVLFIKFWLAARRLLVILSLARPPCDLKSSFHSLYSYSAVKLVSDGKLWPSPVLLRSCIWKDINKNAISTRRSIAKISQTYYDDFIALVFLNNECLLFDFVGRKDV